MMLRPAQGRAGAGRGFLKTTAPPCTDGVE